MIGPAKIKPLILYPILVVIGIAAGLFLGARVMAGGVAPGSIADPLVARSYVDQQTSAYIAGLEKRVTDLNARASQLEQALAQLQRQLGITPIPVQKPTPSTQNSTPSTQAPTPQPVQAPAARQLYIKTENSYVNLRQGPGVNHPLAGTAVRGKPDAEPMTVLSQTGDWFQVRLPDGRTGWVAGWLVTERA